MPTHTIRFDVSNVGLAYAAVFIAQLYREGINFTVTNNNVSLEIVLKGF